MAETIIKMLNNKKMAMSTLLYLISAIMFLGCMLISILPFHFNGQSMNYIDWMVNLSDDNLLIKISSGSCWIYLIVCVVRKITLIKFQEERNEKLRVIYSNIYTLDDIVELANSILILLCVLSIFIQYYKNGIWFYSMKMIIIYIVILVKAGGFCVLYFKNKNLMIIDNVLRQYYD